jgi:hypothetical protein
VWWAEAGKYNVLPLDDRFSERLLGREEDTSGKEPKSSTLSTPWCSKDIPERSAPHTKNRSHSMLLREWKFLSRRCRRPNMCKEKAAIYRRGWSLYLKDKKLVYCHNHAGKPTTTNYVRSRTDVYLLELRRRSDSSLRRRLGQKNLVQVAYRPALYIYI